MIRESAPWAENGNFCRCGEGIARNAELCWACKQDEAAKLTECDACGEQMPCCTHRETPHGEGEFCHRCRFLKDGECDECADEESARVLLKSFLDDLEEPMPRRKR